MAKDTTQFIVDESLLADSELEMEIIENDDVEVPETEIPDMPDRWVRSTGSKPNSAAARTTFSVADGQADEAGPSRSKEVAIKPLSKSKPEADMASPVVNVGMQTCPVCSKELSVDNAGLNAHIDYCLSKDTIRLTASSSGMPQSSRTSNATRKTTAGSVSSGGKRKERSDEGGGVDDDGRTRPKAKSSRSGSGSSGKKKTMRQSPEAAEFRLSQSEFGRAGFTKLA